MKKKKINLEIFTKEELIEMYRIEVIQNKVLTRKINLLNDKLVVNQFELARETMTNEDLYGQLEGCLEENKQYAEDEGALIDAINDHQYSISMLQDIIESDVNVEERVLHFVKERLIDNNVEHEDCQEEDTSKLILLKSDVPW